MAVRLSASSEPSTFPVSARARSQAERGEPRDKTHATISVKARAEPTESLGPVNEPPRPSGFSALVNRERAQFVAAAAHAADRSSERDSGTVPDDYGDDDGAPIGPSEEEEAAFLAEDSSSHFSGGALESSARSLDTRSSSRVEADDNGRPSGPLPSLEALRGRIAPEVLGLMEELFRAKLTRVVRVGERDLKEAKRSH